MRLSQEALSALQQVEEASDQSRTLVFDAADEINQSQMPEHLAILNMFKVYNRIPLQQLAYSYGKSMQEVIFSRKPQTFKKYFATQISIVELSQDPAFNFKMRAQFTHSFGLGTTRDLDYFASGNYRQFLLSAMLAAKQSDRK